MRNSFVYVLLFVSVLEEVVSLQNRIICSSINLKNGRVRRRQRGRFVKFACNNGYLLAGERHSTCTHGQWDPQPPKCVRPTCANKVKLPNNGLIYPSHNGAALHFFCKAGFELRGPAHVYCDGLKWDNNVPTCISSSSKPALFCDFEDEYLCGWTHDLNHDFDWKRENYNTPSGSIGTGPSFDHTKGAGEDGYYMYIESSSRNEYDTARLISPVYDKSDGDVCFQFFYHMYGATTGSLRVYLKTNSSSWDLNPNDAFFSLSGNQGDKWYKSIHMLGIVDEDFQIVIEGVRGNGYVSDIAIDDVKLIENCTDEEYTTTEKSNTIFTDVLPPIVDSCFNRCGQRESPSEKNHITCDCDDNCFDKNRCCPDYFDYCTLTSTSESTTVTDISNDIDEKIFRRGTSLASFIPERSLTHTTEVKRSSVILTSTVSTRLPTKKSTSATTLPTTLRKRNTKRPIIRIQTPPTTQKIVRKIIPSVNHRTTTLANYNLKPLKHGKEIENDVIDLPMQKDNDKALLITSPYREDYFSKEYWSNDEENYVNKPYFKNINEDTPVFRFKKSKSEKNNIVVLSILAAGFFILTVIAFYTIKRYRSPRSRINCSNGDSQSDVRYLRESELLDFSLAQDYNSL